MARADERYGVKRKVVGRPPEVMVIDEVGRVGWSTDTTKATLWNSEIKTRNVMAAHCKTADETNEAGEVTALADNAEVFAVAAPAPASPPRPASRATVSAAVPGPGRRR